MCYNCIKLLMKGVSAVTDSETLFCPQCGNAIESDTCPKCGYSWDPQKSRPKRHIVSDAAVYRLMSAADTYFARKNYNEAYIAYCSVIEADPHYGKAVFRMNLTSVYLMYEASAVYLRCGDFFSKIKRMLGTAVENNADEKLVLSVCKDMLDFIEYISEYERKFALSHKNEKAASAYMDNMMILLDDVLLFMKYVISVNSRESAFVAMKCYETAGNVREKLISGMEYYGLTDSGDGADQQEAHVWLREMTDSERAEADRIFGDICEIRRSILKNADDALYGELKALEKKDNASEKSVSGSESEFHREEYENWRKNNEKAFLTADKRNIIFGILSKITLVFAAVMFLIFIFVVLIYDEAVGIIIGSSVVFAGLGIMFTALERNFENKRKFYAKIIYNDSRNSDYSG